MRKYTLLLLMFASVFAHGQSPAKISATDFKPVFGNWEGSLTYLDYSTGKPFSMPANIAITRLGKQLLFANSYPEEPEANGSDTIKIAAHGRILDGETVISKRNLANGNREIVTETMGVDGNDDKSARIRHTYTIGQEVFAIRKDVQFVGEKDWIMRHEFRYEKRIQIPKESH